MESTQNSANMLSMFPHPVFQVKGGIIVAANQGAKALNIQENASVFAVIKSGQDEYRDFTGGSLSLSIGTGPISMVAAVIRIEGSDFFHLLSGKDAGDLQALALASQHLRDPLSNVITLSENLLSGKQDSANVKNKMRIAQLNQNLHRLIKAVGNMSDASYYADRTSGMETLNIPAVITETVTRTQQQLSSNSRKLTFTTDNGNAMGLADQDMLERAIYNLLSNAYRYSPEDSQINVKLQCDKVRIRITVENSCSNLSADMLSTIFFRYRRAPSLMDGDKGLGLGIPIVQAIASAHKGTVLVTIPEAGKIRFCLTIPVLRDTRGNLCGPTVRSNYTGGYDRSLIELSDILPVSAYQD
jgi:signal transduction histidine kinase